MTDEGLLRLLGDLVPDMELRVEGLDKSYCGGENELKEEIERSKSLLFKTKEVVSQGEIEW